MRWPWLRLWRKLSGGRQGPAARELFVLTPPRLQDEFIAAAARRVAGAARPADEWAADE